ncbi:Adhesion G protein-coupled receptor L3 [Lamellibrachia satsuma]|nr:Adhesion G protein-coupled receptor L3 [Lamellibrachia satsuma]
MSFHLKNETTNETRNCGFWDYSSDEKGGSWSTEGCFAVPTDDETKAVCTCNHMTNFAILMSPAPVTTGIHATILSIISIIGCVISILGLFLTLLLFCSIWKHVKSHHAAVLMNLCIALIIANVIFVVGAHRVDDQFACTIIAALLHYFYLAAFFIMLAEGIQLLLYIVYVFHVRRKRETAFLLFASWGLPAVIVGACLLISGKDGYGTETSCWLSLESGLIWAFIGPACFIIMVNMVILVVVLRRVMSARQPAEKKKHHRMKAAMWNLAVVCPILGITWLFGVFSVNKDLLAFQYIFAISNSLQGVIIFIFHAVCNKKIRDAFGEKKPFKSMTISSVLRSTFTTKKDYTVKLSSTTKRSRVKSDRTDSNSRSNNSKDVMPTTMPTTMPMSVHESNDVIYYNMGSPPKPNRNGRLPSPVEPSDITLETFLGEKGRTLSQTSSEVFDPAIATSNGVSEITQSIETLPQPPATSASPKASVRSDSSTSC